MATFYQNNQTVHGNQNQAETMHVTQISAGTVARELRVALSEASTLDAPECERVTAELEAAGAEVETGDMGAARGRLARLIEAGGRGAEIVNNFAGAVGMFTGGQ